MWLFCKSVFLRSARDQAYMGCNRSPIDNTGLRTLGLWDRIGAALVRRLTITTHDPWPGLGISDSGNDAWTLGPVGYTWDY